MPAFFGRIAGIVGIGADQRRPGLLPDRVQRGRVDEHRLFHPHDRRLRLDSAGEQRPVVALDVRPIPQAVLRHTPPGGQVVTPKRRRPAHLPACHLGADRSRGRVPSRVADKKYYVIFLYHQLT